MPEFTQLLTKDQRIKFMLMNSVKRYFKNEISGPELANAFLKNKEIIKKQICIIEKQFTDIIRFLNGENLPSGSFPAFPPEGELKIENNKFDKKQVGWKIHLGVTENNQGKVFDWLTRYCPYTCKYKAGGEEGKEFTIYIGSFEEMVNFVKIIEQSIGNKLMLINGMSLITDMSISDKIAARFSFNDPGNSVYEQYGYFGIPYRRIDRQESLKLIKLGSIVPPDALSKEQFKIIKENLKKAYLDLSKEFGPYFSGKNGEAGIRLLDFVNRSKTRLGVK